MAIVVIEGKRLDTSKAKQHWSLDYHDGRNLHTGDLYLSSKGTWYIWTPSQWGNGQRWELIDPTTAIERYGDGLSDEAKTAIIAAAKLETE